MRMNYFLSLFLVFLIAGCTLKIGGVTITTEGDKEESQPISPVNDTPVINTQEQAVESENIVAEDIIEITSTIEDLEMDIG